MRSKFKVGDWVEVHSPKEYDHFHGKVGMVTDLPTSNLPYFRVLMFPGPELLWTSGELILTKSEDSLALEVLGEDYFA